MQLKRKQKTELLKWIAEGLQSNEINERAAKFNPPFNVSRQQVDHYRKTRRLDLEAIAHISEQTALTEGYAAKQHRVYKLSLLAALMEKDLLGGLLWTEDDQILDANGKVVAIEEKFNKPEVESYRGVLDDIAREMGGRVVKTEGEMKVGVTVWEQLMAPRGDDGNFEQDNTDAWGRQNDQPAEGDTTA